MDENKWIEEAIAKLDRIEKVRPPADMANRISNHAVKQQRQKVRITPLRYWISIAASVIVLIMLNTMAFTRSNTAQSQLSADSGYDLMAIQTLYND